MRSTADLREYLEAVDVCYFDGALEELGVTIAWMRHDASDVRVGSYRDGKIEINRRLAHDWVPRSFVLQIVFHEGIHALHGPEHDHAFHAAEKLFALSYEAMRWERDHFDKVVAAPVPKGLR